MKQIIISVDAEVKLNTLLAKAIEEEKGFEQISNHCKNFKIKSFLAYKFEERRLHIQQILEILVVNGLEVKVQQERFSGGFEQTWMDMEAFLNTNTDEGMLEEIVFGEKAALKDYDEILEKCTLEESNKKVLVRQRSSIYSSYLKADFLADLI